MGDLPLESSFPPRVRSEFYKPKRDQERLVHVPHGLELENTNSSDEASIVNAPKLPSEDY